MAKKRIVTGLDIGTTKICAIQGYLDQNDEIHIIGSGTHPSYGVRCGRVVDIEQTVEAIQGAVHACEISSGRRIRDAFVGIAGNHVRSVNIIGGTEIANPQRGVTEEDRRRAIQRTIEKVQVREGETLIHCIPQEFAVDDAKGVLNPIGMTGNRLTVKMHLVYADTYSMGNITRCIQRAGITPRETVLESLASGIATISHQAREVGALLMDIGGGTTDIALMERGSVVFSGVVPLGGDNISNDIAKVFGCSREVAENLKIHYARAVTRGIESRETVEFEEALTGKYITRPLLDLCEIVEARLEQIFGKVRELLVSAGVEERVRAGIVLTGGTCLLKGIDELAMRIFEGKKVTVGQPVGVRGMSSHLASPTFSTCVGLVIFGLNHDPMLDYPLHSDNVVTRFVERMKRFFDLYFY